MGKDLKNRELGLGISQRKDGYYSGRYTDRFGNRQQKYFKKLQDCKKWMAEATYVDEHSNINKAQDMMVDAWFDYWISIKEKTVRPNTVRNYTERYNRNIKDVIGKKVLSEVKPIDCQIIMNNMADQGYKTTTIYQTRIALYNMLEFAKENDIIIQNPCKKSVKSDIGAESRKREALSKDVQRKFLEAAKGSKYENAYRFILQTGLRTGELVGLRWSDIDFDKRTLTITRSMEFRHAYKEWRIGPPKSKSGYRTIPLTNEAITILKAQKKQNARIKVVDMEFIDTVFLCRKGSPVKNSTYDTGLFKLCEKAGIPHFSMHILRHTFATRCIEAGMIPKTLQVILGHSNIGITMNLYVHVTEEEKIKEITLIEDALKNII